MNTQSPDKDTASAAKSRKWWRRFLTIPIITAFVLGILFVAVFNTTMEWANTESFCITCHEMRDNVYREYQTSVHNTNRSGVRAICSDCHVPKEFVPKMIRKIQASNEVLHKILGTIDTPEKFEAKRAKLAQNEWRRMKANDSRECRNCHDSQSFDLGIQGYRSVNQHEDGLLKGQTCIDCHKGVVHRLPSIAQGINLADPPGIALEVFKPPVPAQKTLPVEETGAEEEEGHPEEEKSAE